MKATFLSASGYTDPSKNNGDCILADNGSELVIYDCGCEEHARRVVEYMDEHASPTTMQTTSTEFLISLIKEFYPRFILFFY